MLKRPYPTSLPSSNPKIFTSPRTETRKVLENETLKVSGFQHFVLFRNEIIYFGQNALPFERFSILLPTPLDLL